METILIKDGDEAILDVLTTALEMEGFEVVSVNTCDEKIILRQIAEKRPHAVILDIRLSEQDCIDACKVIKQQYPHLPVIAISCNANIHEQYDKQGFDDYIKKPFDLDLLYRILRKHVPQR